jgi:hypothetical protein
MAELHGGRLRLVSEIGVGTTASLILPLDRVKPAGADGRLGEPPPPATVEPLIA